MLWNYHHEFSSCLLLKHSIIYAKNATKLNIVSWGSELRRTWPWTFAVYRLWRDETVPKLNAIQQSAAELLQCDLNIWHSDLKHVLHVVLGQLGCGITFTKFDLRQLIHARIIAFLMLIRCHAVTLTFDFLTLNFYITSGVLSLYLSTKFERNRIIHGWGIDHLTRFRRAILGGGALLTNGSQFACT